LSISHKVEEIFSKTNHQINQGENEKRSALAAKAVISTVLPNSFNLKRFKAW
jgi:hypothetical protein